MMKIKTEEAVYNIPINNGICDIASKNIDDLIECLTSYCIGKKKNKCVIIDDEGDLIKNSDIEFIYIPHDEDLSQIFEFKPKTLLNSELCSYIDSNQEKFLSIERFRDIAYDFLTDSGIYNLMNIMRTNSLIDIKISIDDFDISRLLQMLSIEIENMTVQERFIILYNIMFNKYKNKYCIVYIDFPVDNKTLAWLEKCNDGNKLILLNNDSLVTNNKDMIQYMLLLSPYDFAEQVNEDLKIINNITYCFHPYVLRNIDQQNEKNIELISRFSDKESTFLIKFTNQYTF